MFHYSVILLLSVWLFLYGFFPISKNTSDFLNEPPTTIGNISIDLTQTYKTHFLKTVLIIIDGLRWDFATAELMPQTMKHVRDRGCVAKVTVESPTVTLPRIKALTTGSVPQYIDVIRNLASSEVLSDSWIHSARKKGLKTVFYGDNTWEKLFPGLFERSEGTTSFFVWDFTEVDDNVTRNVNLELKRTDWDIMVLHYLGLDHIGHVLGPSSSRIQEKLHEMDNIINMIFEKTKHMDTLIMVTGDHGMRDGGGHGGTSYPEITVPFISIGLNCENSSFLQTDIPTNLAILLGLNIPTTSIGIVQKVFLNKLDRGEYLYALRYNTEMLLKKYNSCAKNFSNATKFHQKYLITNNTLYADTALDLYLKCSEKITQYLHESSSKQNMKLLLLIILVLLNLLILLITDNAEILNIMELLLYFSIYLAYFFFPIDKVVGLLMIFLFLLLLVKLKPFFLATKHFITRSDYFQLFLIITCVIHPITFISTSFIEEEHYYWIFLSVTLLMVLTKSKFDFRSIKLVLALICLRFSMDLNSTIENSIQKNDNLANILILEHNRFYHQCFFAFGLLLVFLTITWDLGNWYHKYLLDFFTFICLILIYGLKSLSYHNTLLGKVIWCVITLQKICFKQFSWTLFWVLLSTLLIKPHNVVLISFAFFVSKQINCNSKIFNNISELAMANYMLSNCFYFLQGHRNSLASVDISIGYTGLNDYYPFLVISQVLIHTYTFPVLFHLTFLQNKSSKIDQRNFFETLLTLRVSVMLSTSVVMIVFRHHLFIWSVFAPKLFIESVHTGFLFIEICTWYGYCYFGKYLTYYNLL